MKFTLLSILNESQIYDLIWFRFDLSFPDLSYLKRARVNRTLKHLPY